MQWRCSSILSTMNCPLVQIFLLGTFIVLTGLLNGKQLRKPLVLPSECAEDELFDIVKLNCAKCSKDILGGIPTLSNNRSSLLARSSDGYSCQCQSGYYKVFSGQSFDCLPCPSGSVTSLDGLHCSSCHPEIPFQPEKQQCQICSENSVIDERPSLDGREEPQMIRYCRSCVNGTRPDEIYRACIPCHPSFLSCSCAKEQFTVTPNGICLPNSGLLVDKLDLYIIKYENDEHIKSTFLAENLQAAVYLCRNEQNRTACQILANMCALLVYNLYEGSSQTLSNACSELLLLTKLPSTPFIIYPESGLNEIRKANVIQRRYKIKTKLEFMAARYNANGKLMEFSPLKVGEIQLCQSDPDSLDAGFYFGTNFHQKCQVKVRDLWDSSVALPEKVIFYDLFLIDDDKKVSDSLYPVPILITNLIENGLQVNEGEDEQQWRFVRRFFLVEGLAGIDVKKDSKQDRELPIKNSFLGAEPESEQLRYAKSIVLNVKMSRNDGSGSIYPVWLKISYGLASKEDYSADLKVPIEFKVEYTMDHSKSSRDFSICMGVFCGVAILIAMFRSWSWSKRQGKQAIDPVTISEFFALSFGYIADAFILTCIGFSIHWFIIYKRQSVVHGMLPTLDLEESIYIYLYVAFALKTIRIFHDLMILSHVDIFFIDWERPQVVGIERRARSKDDSSSQDSQIPQVQERPRATPSSSTSEPIGKLLTQDKSNHLTNCPAVSIWRTYFVANEWVELCTYRRISPGLHLFLVLLFLHSFGLENLATADTENHLERQISQRFVPESSTCRIAIIGLTYFLLAFAQLIWRKLISERIYKNKLDEFVDLCSVANVSVFCLLYTRFGYYIHGRSPNGRADVNMKEMHALLKREEEDLCSKRGLLPNSDHQTFEMLLPSAIHEQCNRIRNFLISYSQGAERMQGTGGHLFKVDSEKVVPTYVMLTKFLSGFIEHAFKDIDYTVKDKSNTELILNYEMAESRDRGFFYNDKGHSFEALLFSGCEYTLLTFEFILFMLIDSVSESSIIAVAFSYMIIKALKIMYRIGYRRNLVKKALVDERFLI